MDNNDMKSEYFESVVLTEKIYRLFLDSMKIELKKLGIHDINNIQALIIYQIGKSKLTVGELIQRGYYMGSNVSYNLKKMIQQKYVAQARSDFDKRSTVIHLTDKGLKLFETLDKLMDEQAKTLAKQGFDKDIMQANLRKLENFLSTNY